MIANPWTIGSLLLLLVFPSAVVQSMGGLEGRWKGVLVRDSAETVFVLEFEHRDGTWRGSFGFPEARVLDYPLDRVTVAPPNVTIAGPANSFTLEGTLSENALAGVSNDGAGSATFRLNRFQEQAPYTTEEVRVANGDASLAGSLDLPKGPGPYPAMVLLQGAGPETRWGASRFFSDYFARRGIAALIYDKRGTGQSTGDWRRSDSTISPGTPSPRCGY